MISFILSFITGAIVSFIFFRMATRKHERQHLEHLDEMYLLEIEKLKSKQIDDMYLSFFRTRDNLQAKIEKYKQLNGSDIETDLEQARCKQQAEQQQTIVSDTIHSKPDDPTETI